MLDALVVRPLNQELAEGAIPNIVEAELLRSSVKFMKAGKHWIKRRQG